MSFIRPEASAALLRYREALIGAAVAMIGLWWALGTGGLLGWIGWALIAAGAVFTVLGVQRARFRTGGGGQGVVSVDEGQITYFGPLSGGAVAVRDLDALVLDPTSRPPHWVLTQPGQPPLHIPINAEGAERLFDSFATLPGIRTGQMLAHIETLPAHPVVIWQSAQARTIANRLH